MKPNQKIRHSLAFVLLTGSLLASVQAQAGVVVIVNAENPTTATTADVTRIMLGRLNQFPGAGPTLPMLRSTRWEHWAECTQKFIGRSPDEVTRNWATRVFSGQSEPPKVIFTDLEAVQAVATNPAAITCVSEGAVKSNSGVRIIAK